jgi:hypothetical protein
MKRLLMLMMLAVVAVGQSQDPGPLFTDGSPNGRWWLQLNSTEKALVVLGAEAGFHEAKAEISIAVVKAENPICTRSLLDTYREKATHITRRDVVREIDAFYSVGANISLPWDDALVYSVMKLAGATKAEIDAVRKVIVR